MLITVKESIDKLHKEILTPYVISEKDIYSKIKLNIQNYLHDIKNTKNVDLISNCFNIEPINYINIPKYVYVYYAGIVEHISLELNIAVPFWIETKEYFLDYNWFPKEVDKLSFLKETLIKESPKSFSKRNIYISKNGISIA